MLTQTEKDRINAAVESLRDVIVACAEKPAPAWQLSKHIPGFRALADGEEWHRNDFTEEMLRGGWRPCLLNEKLEMDDQTWWWPPDGKWITLGRDGYGIGNKATEESNPVRTRRPLPALPTERVALEAKPWSFETAPRDRMVWVVKNGETSERLVVQWRAFDTIISGGQPSYAELLHGYKQRDGKPCGEARL